MISTDSINIQVAPNTRRYWSGVALFVALLLVASIVVALGSSQARVRARRLSPPPNSTVSTQPTLQVQFARPVDKGSVEGKVLIAPDVPFELAWNENSLRILPRGSLLAESEYTVTIGPGLRTPDGDEMVGQVQWRFRTRQPRIAFIRFSPEAASELWLSDLAGANPQRLSAPGQSVQGYDASPDGGVLAYTVEEGPNTVAIWRADTARKGLTRLTNEPGVVYGSLRFSPSGDLLAVEVRQEVQIADQGPQLGPPRVELRRPTDGSPAGLVYGEQGNIGHTPRWSPDGTRIAFFEASQNGIALFNFTTDLLFFPGESAVMGRQSWSPDGRALAYTVLQFLERGAQQVVVLRDLQMGTENPLGELSGDQADPAWSPDGTLVAYAYKPPAGLDSGGGIWLMRPDGTGRIPLVSEPDMIYSSPLWSPDGQWLLFGRFDRTQSDATESVWAIRRDGSELHQVTPDGSQPSWVP